MSRMKTAKSIDDKIMECENKLRKLKERCDKVTDELDSLYAAKKNWRQRKFWMPLPKAPEPKQKY